MAHSRVAVDPSFAERADPELLAAWRAGDRGAGGELISRHHRLLYRFFRNKADDALEDLVQRTFLSIIEHREEIRDAGAFRGYLLAVAKRELVGHFRRNGRLRDRFDPLTGSVEDAATSPSLAVAQDQERARLLAALRRIPLSFQVALELHYWEGLTAAEIGVVLDLPLGTAKTRIRRGRALLELQLQSIAESPELLHSTLANLEGWARQLRARVLGEADGG